MSDVQADVRRTKIVCTMGPACWSPETIRGLINEGMNVARLNFSHETHESHGRVINDVRAAAQEAGKPIGILQDLAGPKIRLGDMPSEGVQLVSGNECVLVSGKTYQEGLLPVNYQYLYEDVEVGNRILLADGRVELLVTEKRDEQVTCQVIVGGVLTSHKGVNLPTSDLRIPAFTEKDRRDLEFGLANDVDFVAMSFIRHERDLAPLREMMAGMHRPPLLIAKIEKPQALERMSEILAAVDGIMVARGDLGVEMPVEEVPIIQKRLIKEARQAGKVVITATQMLGSMVSSPRPSRAEVTDVANAVLDGTDAVMLSEESAMGKYPLRAVQVLDEVCRYTEPQMVSQRYLREDATNLIPSTQAAITRAVAWLAKDLKPAAIVATTASGSTARGIARYRLPFPLIGFSSNERTLRQLSLSWGVVPVRLPVCESVDYMLVLVRRWAEDSGTAGPDDRLILVAGIPLSEAGTTNLIKVVEMSGPVERGNS